MLFRFIIISILFQYINSCDRPNNDLSEPQIYGGINATKSYPFYVGLHSVSNRFHMPIFCGASLIAPGVVLTAAHCVEFHAEKFQSKYISDTKTDISDLKLIFNISRISDLYKAVKVDVRNIILHDEFAFMGASTIGYDLALLFYDKNQADANLSSIALADFESESKHFQARHKVIGFGRTSKFPINFPPVAFPDFIQETMVPRFDLRTCTLAWKKYGKNITDDYLCFGDEKRDTCGGDSGGPLFAELSNGSNLLVGITSGGPLTCGSPGLPGYYMRVSAFRQWIDETISKNTL